MLSLLRSLTGVQSVPWVPPAIAGFTQGFMLPWLRHSPSPGCKQGCSPFEAQNGLVILLKNTFDRNEYRA